jgi:glutamate-5-semialdehyde dehydrogenase
MNHPIEWAKQARISAGSLARMSTEDKNRALLGVARALEKFSNQILAANENDVSSARALVEKGEMPESLFQRLKLDQDKLSAIVAGVEQVAAMEDPVGKVTRAIELDQGLRLYRVNCPIGVVGVIFESRPDALVQIASLCLKSGNAVLLKGGSEAENSNRCLFDVILNAAIRAGVPEDAMWLLESRRDVNEILKADGWIDLIIPRGSNELVSYIQRNTTIPVLGHAEGLCHIYVDRAADIEMAADVVIDAKVQYPAVCNAVETVLVHRDVARELLPPLVKKLLDAKVDVRCDEAAERACGFEGTTKATDQDWSTEYCDLILSIKVVDSLDEAILHINRFGSRHTDAIITRDAAAWERFFAEVDSAGVFWNASTRFADGYRYGFGAEVGISTGKLHPRGPVGLEGLVTYKYKLVGAGHTVASYSGSGAKPFTHKPIDD